MEKAQLLAKWQAWAKTHGSAAVTAKGILRVYRRTPKQPRRARDEYAALRQEIIAERGRLGRYALAPVRCSAHSVRRAHRLIRRYAGLSRFPRYLSPADRATITSSSLHRDLLVMRSKPEFVQFLFITPAMRKIERLASEIRRIEARSGKVCASDVAARVSHDTFAWGRLSVHQEGRCVSRLKDIGVREIGDNRDWNKKSTLQRFADYLHVQPTHHGSVYTSWMMATNGREYSIYHTRQRTLVAGRSFDSPSVRDTRDSFPIHIQRRILESVLPGDALAIRCDRTHTELMLVSSDGHEYHVGRIDSFSRARNAITSAIAAIRKRRQEAQLRAEEAAKAANVYVSIDDSLASGNCESMTTAFARDIWQQLGATGPCAVRGDIILAARADHYTRRAVAYAIRQHA